jgi:hypothetical protein
LRAFELIGKMVKLGLVTEGRGDHHAANHRIGMLVPD